MYGLEIIYLNIKLNYWIKYETDLKSGFSTLLNSVEYLHVSLE